MANTEQPEISVNGWNADYLESLYSQWSENPSQVDERWQQFFQGFDLGTRILEESPDGSSSPHPPDSTKPTATSTTESLDVAHTKQGQVDSLIYHYRDIGHLAANLNPFGTIRPFPEQLTMESFGLIDDDLNQSFDPGHLPLDNPAPLSDIVQLLEDTYCRNIGVEYMHIQDRDQRRWLQKRMETVRNKPTFEEDHKNRILHSLARAAGLERFLDIRYKGKKWFSLSGAESVIPILSEIVELGPVNGVEEYTCGMAHRGRVNVLVNIFGKSYEELFTEFHESWEEDYTEGGGDVKYHRGYSSDYKTQGGQEVRLTMASNPSHLEFVYPVVLGRCRAKQRLYQNEDNREKVVPILLHGDASFPAQGIVAECLNLMNLDGYRVGGAVHLVINNQIGFTTNPIDARSGVYCTDIAKMINAPIFHVNGDDPEACAFVSRLAIEYRQAFKNDVVIDLWCYRKFGHNESDEPAFTQPQMYEIIKKKTPVFDLYSGQLQKEGVITKESSDAIRYEVRDEMDEAQTRSKKKPVDPTPDPFASIWAGLTFEYTDDPGETAISKVDFKKIVKALSEVPDGFSPHRKLKKLLETRSKAAQSDSTLDWAMGELLAYGSLILEGHAVRLTGQDVERGTFSHRHALLSDTVTGETYVPLNALAHEQCKLCVHNSPLSEQSCVGFEYGYSLADPMMLLVWEAQFGDFANCAQVIIDQFIASAEVKWSRHTGMTLLLPHGYEGQGPEHSSARMERFLQLCADENMQVIYPTTPAQIFHALRRQLKRNFRTPLIVMTPKSLLRHKEAVSTMGDFTSGNFKLVIDDSEIKKPDKVERIIFCSGKIYYELNAHRTEIKKNDVAVIRLEQIYPFPQEEISEILERYSNAGELLWVQEEPLNAGAYRSVEPIMREDLELEINYVGRDASATPAVGSSKMHAEEQAEILAQAFAPFEYEEEDSEEEYENEEVVAAD